MKCDQIQELLLTDYLDGVLQEDLKKKVDAHIKDCPACLEFKKAAIRTTVDVFNGVEQKQPPDHLWARIENALEIHPNEASSVSWWDYLKPWFSNPVPAMAMMVVLFLFAGSAVNQFQDRQAKLNQQSKEFLASVMNSSSSVLISDEDDLGTNEELYFL